MAKEKRKFDIEKYKNMDWKKMLNIIAFIKHVVKDPVNNPKEADERQDEVMQLLIVSIALCLVLGLLSMIPVVGGILRTLALIPGIGIMLSAFLLFMCNKIKKRFKMLTCLNCGEVGDYKAEGAFEKYVSYELVGINTSMSVGNEASKDGKVTVFARGSATASFIVKLTCAKCGVTKKLKYSTSVFECEARQNTLVNQMEIVKINLENKVKEVVKLYEEDETKIPVTIHSKYHPDFENRGKLQVGGGVVINGTKIRFHRYPDEVVEAYMTGEAINGTMTEA